jgi:hypothetical protein
VFNLLIQWGRVLLSVCRARVSMYASLDNSLRPFSPGLSPAGLPVLPRMISQQAALFSDSVRFEQKREKRNPRVLILGHHRS